MKKLLRYNRVVVITLMVALLSLITGLIVLSKIKSQLVQVSTEGYKQQQNLLAKQVADTLSQNLINVQSQLQIMATLPEVQNTDDVTSCNNKLQELLQVSQKQIGNLGRVDAEGTFRCSLNKALIGQPSSKYGTYINDLIKDPSHKPVLSRINKPTSLDSFVTSVHIPVYRNNTFSGTLGGAIYLSKFQDVYLRNIQFGKSGHVVVMDDNGDILYHPSKDQNGKNLLDPTVLRFFEPQQVMRNLLSDVQAGKSGTFDYSVQGTKKVGIYETFNVLGTDRRWSVVVTIPSEDLDHVVNQAGINRIFILLLGLFSLTTALLTFVSLRNIIKNLEVQRMKDDFISITSHQLRTPATIVKQNLGLIMGGYVTSKKDTDKFIKSAYQSNEDQLGIIENILNVSKLEAGHMGLQKEHIILQELISKLATSMKMSVSAKKQKLKVDMPAKQVKLCVDPTKLTMAIENLVTNAVKYTFAHGLISIKVSIKNGTVLIAVKDTGKGIPKAEMSQLFLRFNRLHSAITSHIPGTGLGLYLTKKIIELHGGTITVVSVEKKGSTFTIKLPLN